MSTAPADGTVGGAVTPGPLDVTAETGPPVVPKTLAAFGVPAFRYLWANTFVFMLVQSTQRFTYVWLVLELGRSSDASGVVLFALGVPVFLVAMPAGVLTDRLDRRRILVASQGAALVVTAATAALIYTDQIGIGVTIVLAFLLGVSLAVGQPVRTAVIPSLVPREILMNAIVLVTLGMNLSMIAGPAIGGAAIGLWGVEGAFVLQAVLYAVGLAFLGPLRVPAHAPSAVEHRMWSDIREGVRFVVGRSDMRALFVLLASTGMFMVGPYLALLPEIARDELGAGAFKASLLFAFLGVGMLGSSIFLASRREMERKGLVFIVSLILGGLMLGGMGVSPWYPLSAALMLLWGVGGGLFVNLNQTLIQSHTPQAVMGRVMSLHTLAMQGLGPAGALLAGILAAAIGAPAAVAVLGAAMAAVAVAVLASQPSLRELT